MEHFPDSQWVDFARGVAGARPRAMDEHLRDGCAECLDAYALWRRLVTFAEQEHGLEPPESAVRVAKSYLSGQVERESDRREDGWISTLVATLTFDSRLQPLLAGTRAGSPAASHLLYTAGTFAVDLHVERRGGGNRVAMAGQIADGARPDRPLRDVQVAISDGRNELAAVRANEFGEFQCEFAMQPALTLVLSVSARERIAVPLDDISGAAGSSPAAEHSDE